MGIYIKGIEMPKENQRRLWVVIHSDGTVEYDTGDYGWQTLRQSAFNVPPHGDLIERDKVNLTDFEIVMCNGNYKEGMKMLLEKIESTPTIILAEPLKKDIYE